MATTHRRIRRAPPDPTGSRAADRLRRGPRRLRDRRARGDFQPGDRFIVDPSSGSILHVPADVQRIAAEAVGRAATAFSALARCSDDQITDSSSSSPIASRATSRSHRSQLPTSPTCERARERGRSTTRLELLADDARRHDRRPPRLGAATSGRDLLERRVEHDGWSVEARRAPLGVVAFVFEGRPNVFADAAGVVRTGNTVVFRIGSDALGTAEAIVEHALDPALGAAGLPAGTVGLVASPAHAAGWALFSDGRLSLAVARGSGPAVAQLGAVARQAGVPGQPARHRWRLGRRRCATPTPNASPLTVRHSLDRKVCNTLNVCCIVRRAGRRAGAGVPRGCRAGGGRAGDVEARVHATGQRWGSFPRRPEARECGSSAPTAPTTRSSSTPIDVDRLGHEWEWERLPGGHRCTSSTTSTRPCRSATAHSPHFVASLVSESADAHDEFFYDTVDAPFVGDGFTRWVDGQYALDTPELGLSNWEGGRLLGRGGILSGDAVHHGSLPGDGERPDPPPLSAGTPTGPGSGDLGDRPGSEPDAVDVDDHVNRLRRRRRTDRPRRSSLTIAPLAVTACDGRDVHVRGRRASAARVGGDERAAPPRRREVHRGGLGSGRNTCAPGDPDARTWPP